MQQKSSGGMTTKRLIALIALAVLAVAVIVFAVREIRLYGDVQVEQSRTPTPVPGYGNVMQVTIDPSLPTPVPVLRSGAQGEAVWQLQERLQALGYLTGSVDGQFGPATKEAVQLFQRQHGLTADGIVGEDTRELLYSDSAQPYATPTPAPTQAAQATEAPAEDDMILLTAEAENTIPVGFTADGLPLLVNRDSPLPDDYQPQQLVNMRDYCDSSIVSIKGSEIEGEQIAVDALLAMLTQAQSEGLTSWQISAGYRSVAYQQKLFDDKVYSYRQQGITGAPGAQCGAQTRRRPRMQRASHRAGVRHHRAGHVLRRHKAGEMAGRTLLGVGIHPALPGGQDRHHRHHERAVALPLRWGGCVNGDAGDRGVPGRVCGEETERIIVDCSFKV